MTRPLEGYTSLGVLLLYQQRHGGLSLHEIRHTFTWTIPAGSKEGKRKQVAAESRRQLGFLLEYLEFFSLVPLELGEPVVEPLSHRLPFRTNIPLRVAIGGSVPLPPEEALTSTSFDPRLRTWLHLFNDAGRTEDDAHAIRCYCLILEDVAGELEADLYAVRNLVSHPHLDYPHRGQLRFLQERLSISGEVRFDPTNPEQQKLLAEMREVARRRARRLIEERVPTADG